MTPVAQMKHTSRGSFQTLCMDIKMKKLIPMIVVLCVVFNASATRVYHPHKKKIEVTFSDGDRVVITTKYTDVSVTGIEIISHNNITYTIPEKALSEIKRPQIDTLHLTFQCMGEKYQEGTFGLYFNYKPNETETYKASFYFENGVLIKKQHNQSVHSIAGSARSE